MEQTAGVRRYGFEITALGLSVKRTESERRFPRTRHSRKDHELVARYVQIDVFEIVLPRSAYANKARKLLDRAYGRVGSEFSDIS